MAHPLYAAMRTSIFEEISLLARAHDAINLGQGFPDWDGPAAVRQAAADAIMAGPNQYPPSLGLPALREAVAAHYARWQGLTAAPAQVLVTAGATEALAAAILALVQDGDEVVIFQPAYDAYAPLVRRAGGVPRFVTLRPPGWRLERDAIEAAIGPRTRMLILNDPMNPCARVFDRDELGVVAELCVAHDLVALCDEVWEHVLLDGRAHMPLIGLPGMAARTVKVGSAGKIFSMTGWKIGWVIADEALLRSIAKAHQYLQFAAAPALQAGIAHGLSLPDATFDDLRATCEARRDRLAAALVAAGYAVLPGEGSYFLCVDLAASGIARGDRDFCLAAIQAHGVAAIPLSAFYEGDGAPSVIRLCFAKDAATLDEAARRLADARAALSYPA